MKDRRKLAAGDGPALSTRAVVAFFLTLGLCSLLIVIAIRHKASVELMTMERLIVEKSIAINEVLTRLLYKTQALSALVIQSDGEIENFHRVAATIVDDPAIFNILVAPGGVIADIYPKKGNVEAVGYNLLGQGPGNREAIMAKDMNRLLLGGPFKLMQGGGDALVGRLPVWMDEPDGRKRFWGLVSVTLRYPQALQGAGLETLGKQGFAFEIWRINPDDDERQIIASSSYDYNRDTRYIERPLQILNAEWFFRILPVRGWHEYPDNWMLIFIGLCVSVMVAVIMQNNCDLKLVKSELESLVRTDALTGLLNRNGMFYELERLVQRHARFRLCFLDLDRFKAINDTYGHNVGDRVLTEFSRRVEKRLGDDFIFARIGGDEFVLIRMGEPMPPEGEDAFWRGVEQEFAAPVVNVNGTGLRVAFSKGIASFPEDGAIIDELLTLADSRMYEEKHARYAAEAEAEKGRLG